MKNIHKMLIFLISFTIMAGFSYAQSDMSPKLKTQLEEKTKTPSNNQQLKQIEAQDMAPSPQQLIQQRMEEDGTLGIVPKEQGGPTDNFCAPTFTSGCDFGDGFTDFAVEEIENYGSGCEDNTGTPGWSEYYSLGPATLVPGFTHTFTMGVGFVNQYVNIWIDFNDDDDLTADELILVDYWIDASGVLYDVDVLMPATATPGEHKMRAMAVYAGTFTDPCGSYSYGEAEDYTVNVITPDYGDLEGFVTENTGGAAVEGATVNINGGLYSTTSGSDGYYSFTDVLVGDWPIECMKTGYNVNSGTVTIEVGTTVEYDFALTAPTMEIDPMSISITIDPFAQMTEMIDISNNGDGPLMWNAQLEMITDGTEEQFDVVLDVPVGIGGGEAGIETDGMNIYTSMWNGAGEFQKYDMEGNWIETVSVAGSTGCRDIAYDGNYFYGAAASTTIFEMDIASGTMISTFTGPAACRAIAYNENDDAFYCNNWSDNITKFDKAGANLGSFPVGPIGISYYGFAYDNYSGGEYLWGYAQTGNTLNELVQIELPSGVETGFSLDVGSITNVGAGLAGGLAIDNNIAPGLWSILGTSQNENIWALELAPAGAIWISIDPNSGDVEAGEMGEMAVNFDATDIVAGTVKTAEITFYSNPEVGMVTVPVSMTVGSLDFGYVEGTVTLDGSAPYNIGNVEEVMVQVGPYTGYPDATGFYSIETYPGTYDVTATLYGYDTQLTADVVVAEGGTVTVDFTMPCLYGIVSGTVTAEDGGAPIEGAAVMLLDTEFETTTAADGTYEIIVQAGTYDVKVTAPFFASQTVNVVIDPEATTAQDFVLPTLDGIIVVIDLDPTPNPQIADVIQNFFPGGLVEYTTNINGYPLDEQVQTVFLLLGIYSNNYNLTETDAVVITDWLDTYGGNLYMEGGDTWAFDAPTSLHAYFNINGVVDGAGDLANINGIDSFWSGFEWGYAGENNWIDHLEAIAPAIEVLENPDAGYFCGVAYDAGDYKTVGASFEVTGVVDGAGSFDMGIATIMGFFGYPVFAYGDLEGYVTESGTGNPIEDAMVSLGGLGEDMTDATGYYLIEDVLVGTWTVNCTKDGYNPESAEVTIEEEVTTTQDFVLTAPAFNVDPTSISVTLDPNASTTETITIENPGSGVVGWSASLSIAGDGNSDAMFDVIFDVPVGIGGGEAGIETDGQYIYTSMWNGAGEFQRYSMDGTWIETISVAGSTGCRDIAYDGTYFYGGAAATTIFEMDLANATMISTFTGPAACRAIAYNHNEDAFYCNNWSDNITKFDKSGANLGSFPAGPYGQSYYGFAYDSYSGGEFLWGYAQVGNTLNELVQIELPSGVETGVTFDVGSVTNVGAGIAGGMGIHDGIQSGVYAFLGTSQNENIWALELTESQTWITISPTSGSLDPNGSETMEVMLDATGLLPGFYYADINFSTNPNVGSPVVTVELEVAGLIPAINLNGMYNCTDVELSWEMPAGGDADSWNVYRDGVLLDNVTDMMHTDEMVDPEVDYEYTVTAVYGAEESFPTPAFMMNVPVPEDLEPLNPDATHIGAGDILITWETPDACLAPDEYDVYRDGSYIGTTSELEYTDEGLTTGFYEYYVVAVYYFGESGNSSPAYVLVGIGDVNATDFQIYPNPASDIVNVKSDYHVISLEVLNNAGQTVYSEDVESSSFNVNVSQFDRGIYYFKLKTDDQVILRKIAVK